MDVSEIRKALCAIQNISFSKHFQEKAKTRGIDEQEIMKCLASPDKLFETEDQGEDDKGHKYALLFKKSNKYDLRVIASVNGVNLNVITAHVQNIKRRKAYQKWVRKRR